jgi:hypothetical protein
MTRLLRSLYLFIVSKIAEFRFGKIVVEDIDDIKPEAVEPTKPRAKREPKENPGSAFYFRGSILDELDAYFYYIRRMRKADRFSTESYKSIGITLAAPDVEIVHMDNTLTAWWRAGNRPGFGAHASCLKDDDFEISKKTALRSHEGIYPKFTHFTKMKLPPAFVQRHKGDIYHVSAYLDGKDFKHKHGGCFDFYVVVDEEAKVHALKINTVKAYSVAAKRSRTNGKRGLKGRGASFTCPTWDYPRAMRLWWADAKGGRASGKSLEEWTVMVFCAAASAYEHSLLGLRVIASKGDTAASFAIDIKRTAYFFRDREKVDGKRIFHIVRAHKRITRKGVESYVKFHFRGERFFVWNGYRVAITLPKNQSLFECDLEAYDEEAAAKKKMGKLVPMGHLADLITEIETTGKVNESRLKGIEPPSLAP